MLNMFLLFTGDTATEGATAGTGSSTLIMILYIVGIFAFLYFMIIRPQKKRQRETVQMQSAIKIGDSVMTTGGLYGTVVDIVNDLFIVEFGMNKGVRVPVVKSAISSVSMPDLTMVPKED